MALALSRERRNLNAHTYLAPRWLPGGNLQTVYARSLGRRFRIEYRRERWDAPDGDFIDLDWLPARNTGAKLLVLFHGLEGCSRSHYALSLMSLIEQRGWAGVVPHFRGCSGEINRLARAYHSGDSLEIDWILRRLKAENPTSAIYAAGVSLGGNMLLKWLGEQGAAAAAIVDGAVAISAPVDLNAAAAVLDRGYRRVIYTRHFLASITAKVAQKIDAHNLKMVAADVRACRSFRQIDDLYTAPIHGFRNAEDYWTRASSKPYLSSIQVPTLLINARNDPFLPAACFPSKDEVSNSVTCDFPAAGGHVGFVSGSFPGTLDWLPRRVIDFVSTLHE